MASDEEKELFRKAVGDVVPLSRDNKSADLDPKRIKKVLSETTSALKSQEYSGQSSAPDRHNQLAGHEFISPVDPLEILAFKHDGVQHGVYRKLKLGKYPIQASLDLHRRTVEQARNDVYHFIVDCVDDEVRCAMIIHGKGLYRENQALLKSCTNHWLRQMDEVLAIHSARPRDGGAGSVYVLLRKG